MKVDDPKFTAHVLGEIEDLTPAERAEIEALLASDPAAAAEAAETRALAARLRTELLGEAAAPLQEHQRAAVLEAAKTPFPPAKIVAFPRRATFLAALAACVVVGISIGLSYQALVAPNHESAPPLAVAAASTPQPLPTNLADLATRETLPHVQLVGMNAPQVSSPQVPPPQTSYADTGLLKTGMDAMNVGTPATPASHMASVTATNVNSAAGTTVISMGSITVNNGVTTFTSSTVTTLTASTGSQVVQMPKTIHSGNVLANYVTDGTADEPHPRGLSPESASQEKKNGRNKITTVTTSDGRVRVTLDTVEADGSITHTIALADQVAPVGDTGDIYLYGMPDVIQGGTVASPRRRRRG